MGEDPQRGQLGPRSTVAAMGPSTGGARASLPRPLPQAWRRSSEKSPASSRRRQRTEEGLRPTAGWGPTDHKRPGCRPTASGRRAVPPVSPRPLRRPRAAPATRLPPGEAQEQRPGGGGCPAQRLEEEAGNRRSRALAGACPALGGNTPGLAAGSRAHRQALGGQAGLRGGPLAAAHPTSSLGRPCGALGPYNPHTACNLIFFFWTERKGVKLD